MIANKFFIYFGTRLLNVDLATHREGPRTISFAFLYFPGSTLLMKLAAWSDCFPQNFLLSEVQIDFIHAIPFNRNILFSYFSAVSCFWFLSFLFYFIGGAVNSLSPDA